MKYAFRWADAECDRQGATKDYEGYRNVLGDILPLIRFNDFTSYELFTDVIPTKILTEDQLAELKPRDSAAAEAPKYAE